MSCPDFLKERATLEHIINTLLGWFLLEMGSG